MILPVWLPQFLGKLTARPSVRSDNVPDDIIIDILSRLPAEDVIICKRVCKNWLALISTPSFAKLHLKRGVISAPPSIFLQELDKRMRVNKLKYQICDTDVTTNIFGTKTVNTKIHTQWFHDTIAKLQPAVSSSCDGLLAFVSSVQPDKQIFILNPVLNELVRVTTPIFIFAPCGIYRDPPTHEFKLLLTTTHDEVIFHYYTASLSTMVIKKLNYSSTWRAAFFNVSMIPSNKCLHWFVDNDRAHACGYKIMVFNTKTDDFRVLPHPGDELNCSCILHFRDMELLEMKGDLWFCIAFTDEIQVWVLEDHSNWEWDKRYSVRPDWSTWRFPFSNGTPPSGGYTPLRIKIKTINNGVELLICWFQRGMCWYNLEKNTIRKASIFEEDESRLDFGFGNRPICSFAYTKTLVRLDPLTPFPISRHQVPQIILKYESV